MTISLNVNGTSHAIDAPADMPLLWALRDVLGLTGTKFGCGAGLCGACTVHVGGQALRSCQTKIGDVKAPITTIEGLSADGNHPVQKAWREERVPQCGYCQAGQIMQAATFLSHNPKPTRDQVASAMSENICRCGCYKRIHQAVINAAGA